MRVHSLNAAIKIGCIGAELRGISDARLAHRLGLAIIAAESEGVRREWELVCDRFEGAN